MNITSVQKVINIGTSAGVTIPARDLKATQIKVGDQVKVTVEKLPQPDQLDTEYEQFKAKYQQALENLADR